jgi:hypothetical protein
MTTANQTTGFTTRTTTTTLKCDRKEHTRNAKAKRKQQA